MAWIILILAGLFEIGWAIGLKYSDGFTKLTPSVLTAGSMVISVVLLGLALRDLPVGSAYAVWTGIGTVGTALLGMYIFGEPATVVRLVCIGLIVAGIGGLKFLAIAPIISPLVGGRRRARPVARPGSDFSILAIFS